MLLNEILIINRWLGCEKQALALKWRLKGVKILIGAKSNAKQAT
jgi:hypothetical protein